MQHATTVQLEASLDHLNEAPRDAGTIEMIVRRPNDDLRETLDSAEVTVDGGLDGDNWKDRGDTPNYEAQITIMSSRYADLIATSRERWPLAGDQIYVDLDLSVTNLPPGTRLAVGEAVVEVSATPHTGCAKFKERFGRDALRFANSEMGREMRLRGVNTRVIESGRVATGDTIKKV